MALAFADALAERVARAPGDPLVTYYDDGTGERVELSFATYANWVAKTGSLLQDELTLERGALVAVDLPTHWLGTVWLGAAWSLGMVAADASAASEADLVVCGPDGVERHGDRPVEVVACSLLPMGARFADPLPTGVIDFGEVVWSQPDRLLVLDPAGAGDRAWTDAWGVLDQTSLLTLPDAPRARLVTALNPCSRPGLSRFVGPLLSGAGAVWTRGGPPERLQRIARDEHAEVDEVVPPRD
jgi:uncharacterized protein (TIGR03089 family)